MAATRVSIESLTGEQVGSLAPTTTVQEAKVLLGLGAGTMFFSDATQEVTGTFEGLDRAVVIPKEAPEKPVTPVELDAFAVKQQTDELERFGVIAIINTMLQEGWTMGRTGIGLGTDAITDRIVARNKGTIARGDAKKLLRTCCSVFNRTGVWRVSQH
jgi:hypothetical protein